MGRAGAEQLPGDVEATPWDKPLVMLPSSAVWTEALLLLHWVLFICCPLDGLTGFLRANAKP